MAERRMFSKAIVDSDLFLDMPATSQNLYFHLAIRADDEGFVSAPQKIIRFAGANKNDFDILLAKGFLVIFDSGIIVITHWMIHNLIRKDRLVETQFKHEKSLIRAVDGAYTLELTTNWQPDGNQVTTNRQPTDNHTSTKRPHRLGKGRLGKDRLGENNIAREAATPLSDFLAEQGFSAALIAAYTEYIEYRAKAGKSKAMSLLALQKLVAKTKREGWTEQETITSLGDSIAFGYTGVFRGKQSNVAAKKPKYDLTGYKFTKELPIDENDGMEF